MTRVQFFVLLTGSKSVLVVLGPREQEFVTLTITEEVQQGAITVTTHLPQRARVHRPVHLSGLMMLRDLSLCAREGQLQPRR